MCLTTDIRYVNSRNEAIEGVITLRDKHRHMDLKLTPIVGDDIACRHQLLLRLITTPPIPEGTFTVDGIVYLRSLHGNTGITLRMSFNRDGITGMVLTLILIKLHLKGRTFVLLYLKGCRTIPLIRLQIEITCQSTAWQGKHRIGTAVLIRCQRLFLHHLMISVTQCQGKLFIGNHFQFLSFHGIHQDSTYMYGLSRTIDTPVGKQRHAGDITSRF